MKSTFLNMLAASSLLIACQATANEPKPNPFTGRSATIEAKINELEIVKIESAIANERLMLTKAITETGRVNSGQRGAPASADAFTQNQPILQTNQPPAEPQRINRKQPVAVVVPTANSAPMAPQPHHQTMTSAPKLIGTSESQDTWSAIVYIPAINRAINMTEGVTVEGFTATKIGPQIATVNGIALRLGNITARTYLAEQALQTSGATIPPNSPTTQLAQRPTQNPMLQPMDLPLAR